MKKALLVFGLCFLLFCTGLCLASPPKVDSPVSASSPWDIWGNLPDPGGAGLGTETSPYIIRNATDISNRLPTSSAAAQNQHYILMSDITLSGEWTPRFLTLGSVFDGNNYRISGLVIRQASGTASGRANNRGFFDNVSGTVKNITFVKPDVNSAGSNIAVVAANVSFATTVPLDSRVAKFSRVFIERAADLSKGSVSGNLQVGGIIGQIADNTKMTIVESCFNSANINASGAGHAGGIVARSGNLTKASTDIGTELYVTHCGNEGSITANSTTSNTDNGVGGIVGCVDGGPTTVILSYNTGTIVGHAGIIGLVRVDTGKVSISNCYNDAQILTGTSTSARNRLRAAIVLRANANTEIWAENNWYNTDKTDRLAYARGHTPNAGGDITGGDILPPIPFTDNYIAANPGALADALNTGSGDETGLGFGLISGQIKLLALTRTRIITFLPMGAPGAACQRHLSPDDPSYDLLSLSETKIGDRFGFDFIGWRHNGTLYSEGFPFPIQHESPLNIEFEAVWNAIDYKIVFHESSTALFVGATTPLTFNIDQSGLMLAASNWVSLNRPIWMIKKAGTQFPENDEASWIPLSNENNFQFSDKVQESADGMAFLTAYADNSNTLMIKLVSYDSTNSHLIEVTTERDFFEAGMFGYTLDNDQDSIIEVNLSFGHFIFSDERTITKLYIATANDYYEFVRIDVVLAGGQSFSLENPVDGFLQDSRLANLKTDSSLHVVFKKIPFKFKFTPTVVSKQNPKSEVPSIWKRNDSSAMEYVVDDNARIFVEARKELYSGLNAFRFADFKIWNVIEDEYVPLWLWPTTDDTGLDLYMVIDSFIAIDSAWLDTYSSKGVVLIIAEYIPLYRITIGSGDILAVDGSLTSIDDTLDVIYSYYDAVDAITVWPSDNTFFVPESSTICIETNTSIFFANGTTDLSFFYQLSHFDNLPSGGHVIRMAGNTIASFEANSTLAVTPVFTPRPFEVTFEAKDSDGKTIPNVASGNFGIIKVSPQDEGNLRIGDIFTALEPQNLPALSGYRFEGFTAIGVAGYLTQNHLIESAEFFINNIKPSNNKVLITARYTQLFELKAGVSGDSINMGVVKVYKGSEIHANLVYEGSGRDSNGMLLLHGRFERTNFIITAVPSYGFEFVSFGGTYDDGSENPDATHRISITVTEIRTITAHFRALPVSINENLTKQGWGTTSADIDEELLAGEKIYIFANPGLGSEVKKWTINKVIIEDLPNIQRFGNMIEVTLTSEWLSQYGDMMNSHISFGFTWQFILFAIGPAVLIPLLAMTFLVYYLNLQRKKKIIKAALLADKQARAGFNQHILLSDVREGKAIGGVSDADVKSAIEAKKEKKKRKEREKK